MVSWTSTRAQKTWGLCSPSIHPDLLLMQLFILIWKITLHLHMEKWFLSACWCWREEAEGWIFKLILTLQESAEGSKPFQRYRRSCAQRPGQRDENVATELNNSEPQFLKSAPNMIRSPERRPSFNYKLCSWYGPITALQQCSVSWCHRRPQLNLPASRRELREGEGSKPQTRTRLQWVNVL